MDEVGTIYLVRHGETVWNREGRLQGQSDSPLTDRGLKQAQAVGKLLRRVIGDAADIPIFVSPLERALRTAEAICGPLGRNPACLRTDDLLKEISFGRWEGMIFKEIAVADPENWKRFELDRWSVAPPDGESYAMMAARVRQWLRGTAVVREKIVVAHGGFCRVLRGMYCGASAEETLALDVPQDVVFRIAEGTVERIEA